LSDGDYTRALVFNLASWVHRKVRKWIFPTFNKEQFATSHTEHYMLFSPLKKHCHHTGLGHDTSVLHEEFIGQMLLIAALMQIH